MREWGRDSGSRGRSAFANLMLSRPDLGNPERAAALLDQALVIAQDLGMPSVVERAVKLKAKASASQQFGGEPLGDIEPTSPVLAQGQNRPPLMANAVMRREGEYWTIAQEDVVLRLKDVKGLHYVAHLLKNPGHEFHALELIGVAPESSGSTGDRRRSGSDEDKQALDLTGLGAVLDDTAKAQYRNRRRGLQEDLEEAEQNNDIGRAAALRAELDALNEQLAGATGLAGKDRNPGSSAERARLTVTKGIKAVVKKIHDGNPSLGRHLATRVRTGHLCCYTPDPDRPIRWIF